MTHEWSEYQKGIFHFVESEDGHGCVKACAGSAKTTTAVESMKKIPVSCEIYFGTFTRAIADELAKRVPGRPNIEISNYNSFAWRVCLRSMKTRPEVDVDKTDNILKYRIFGNLVNDQDRYRYYKCRYNIKRLVSFIKSQNVHTVEDAAMMYNDVVQQLDIEVPDGGDWFYQVFLDTYDVSINNTQYLDYDDQKLMPLKLGLPIPQFDFLIVDEYQDTCLVEDELMKAALAENGRFLIIGDPDQSIYAFRGADPERMNMFIEERKAKLLPLYICYRCSKAAVNEAKKIVPHIEAAPNAVEGFVDTITKAESAKRIQDGDLVLSRVTSKAVEYCLDRVREGRRSWVRGKEIGKNLISFIESVGAPPGLSAEILYGKLRTHVEKKVADLSRFGKEGMVAALQDKMATIDALILNCQTTKDLRDKIDSIFQEKGDGIECMTCHRSKGLEGKPDRDVHILRPDLLPHPKGDPAEELRIKYVAQTRTKRGIYYVLKDKDEK